MKYTVVLPYAYRPYFDECMKTCKLENVLAIDNTVNNIGIMKAHNLGIEKMIADDSDWLIIMSAAIRFGEKGGLDFIEELEKRPNDIAVEAIGVYGWHLIAFNRKTIERVGKWDENFTPYGYDDLDYSWRIQCAYELEKVRPVWVKVPVDVADAGMGHSIHLGKIVTQDDNKLREYFIKKWGDIHHPKYKTPFNIPDCELGFWPV